MRLTAFRLRSIRFVTRSEICSARRSSFPSPEWMRWRKPSMFILVHVSVTIPGWILRSMSCRCGLSSGAVMGSSFSTTASYCSNAYANLL